MRRWPATVLVGAFVELAGQTATNRTPPRDRTPGPQQLAWVDRSGRVIDSVGESMQILSDIAISADGRRIAVRGQQNGNDDIWVYDVGSEARTRVTDHAAAERHPAWTAAGRVATRRIAAAPPTCSCGAPTAADPKTR